ncbi:DNA-binding LacI/PurR family transcriptional regulator [Spinactinospora alkalitolerans]|uniref:DNA-binding LacI/PurR family transcriptional regulator n=1 Tax=Spinactinospora alkalitolerans TaxID=687207 RepID=A0A852TTG3_9ACTN|nr:LacI family DNA-binding transcriptional regulator [Spinactinospora alkalitolerans]NYE46043.1 DNA-binding LacI/PurR family transcriptional regulator [Spinactinospora alkalitolerans]
MATIKDVARAAGVAPSTVSYVLSGSRKISAETRVAVQAAIEELGYHPNAGARSLRSTRTNVIALALPLPSRGYLPVGGRFTYGLGEAAGEHGYDLLLITAAGGGSRGPGLERVARSRLADAAVLMGVEMEDPRIGAMRALGFPVAVLGRPADESAAPWADLDWEEAAAASVRTLHDAGHRRICYLATVEDDIRSRRSYSVRGIDGADRIAAELGAQIPVCPSSGDPEELRRRLDALFDAERPPTALAVQHPAAIPGILRHLAGRGLQVPRDVSLVAIGNFPEDLGGLDVTRIELPVQEMSAAVTRLAVAAIEGAGDPGPAARSSAGHVLIPPRITRGGTVAPAP